MESEEYQKKRSRFSAMPTFIGNTGKRSQQRHTEREPQESVILEDKGGASFENVAGAVSSLQKDKEDQLEKEPHKLVPRRSL